MVVQRMLAEVSVADSSSGPAVSCAALGVGTAAITASSATPHGIKPATITNGKVRMKLFMSVTLRFLMTTRSPLNPEARKISAPQIQAHRLNSKAGTMQFSDPVG